MHTAAHAQEIIAHRGASYLAPENTLAAVKLGYALGADAVEIDIHMSRDNQLMVIHDADTRRTAGGKNLVVKETAANALRQLDVGSWKDPKYAGEKIPLLSEVMQLVPEGKQLVIEMKPGPELLPYLQQQIQESGIAERLILISFNLEAIISAKQLMSAIPAYWLLHDYQEHTLEEAIQLAKAHQLNGLDVHHKLVDKNFMQQMQAHQLAVYVYTVNNAKVAKVLTDLGVKGITTDRPQWLPEQMKKIAEE